MRHAIQDDWRNHTLRTRKVMLAIKALLGDEAAKILNLVKSQHDD